MYNYLINIRRRIQASRDAKIQNEIPNDKIETEDKLVSDLSRNIINIREKYGNSADLVVNFIEIKGYKMNILTVEGMTNSDLITDLITRPLKNFERDRIVNSEELYNFIEKSLVMGRDLNDAYLYSEVLTYIMSGFIVILIDGCDKAIAIGVQGYNFRSISEPTAELNMRGSREGFIEVLRINMSMIRRRMKSPDLRFEIMKIGEKSQTDVCLAYVNGVVSETLLREIRHKLKQIKLTTVLDSGYLQPFLEGRPHTLFSDVGTTERPDTVIAKINEGRVVIIVDGTPFALIIPYLFMENFQSLDDYCHKPYYAFFIRTIKYISFFITILLPGLYVAIFTFHPELFPYEMIFNVASSEAVTPFPTVIEALIIYIIYEIMREGGLRLPRPVGHAISIVGALVIGDAAVTAGLIAAPMVMIVALTAICSFVVSPLYEPSSVLRFVFIFLGGISGFFGITIGLFILLISICGMNNLSVPYMSSISPMTKKALRDTYVRTGWDIVGDDTMKITDLNGVNININGGEIRK